MYNRVNFITGHYVEDDYRIGFAIGSKLMNTSPHIGRNTVARRESVCIFGVLGPGSVDDITGVVCDDAIGFKGYFLGIQGRID